MVHVVLWVLDAISGECRVRAPSREKSLTEDGEKPQETHVWCPQVVQQQRRCHRDSAAVLLACEGGADAAVRDLHRAFHGDAHAGVDRVCGVLGLLSCLAPVPR